MSGTTLHVGKSRVQTLAASDSSTIPSGSVSVAIGQQGIYTAVVDPVTNNITLKGIAVGVSNETISSPGFTSEVNVVTVIAAPSIVATDGPEF